MRGSMFNDLREFIEAVKKEGECKVVEGADWDVEIGTITHLAAQMSNPPLFIFDKIKGYEAGYRVASNLFTTQRRTALGLGLPTEARGIELVNALRDKIKAGIQLIPPVDVETGPIKENILTGTDVDLCKFPAPKWNELDGGRYIGTGCMGILRDPDEGWINLGIYRTQIHDKSTVTMSMITGHRGEMIRKKYWEKGVSCPIAISCGQDPTLWAASQWPGLPWGISEYDFAGGLRGEPVRLTRGITTDLPIPATAEIVLEGEIVPPEVETRNEGPFGEWCGYYAAGIRPMPAVKITSVLHRDNPIIQGNPPHRLPSLWSLGLHIQKAATLWNELDRQLPGVKGVWMIEEASLHSIPVISLQQSYPGHAKQAALTAGGCSALNYCCRIIIIVDDDIDPSNISEVLWALGTRVDPETSIDIIRGCLGGAANPMLSPEEKQRGNYEMSRATILACKPYLWKQAFPPPVEPSSELARQVREKWGTLFS
jgi:UbiD family decarboxylase